MFYSVETLPYISIQAQPRMSFSGNDGGGAKPLHGGMLLGGGCWENLLK